ncbi:hypothetical protein WN943_026608 [Citrus x changshan-huyou]
MSLIKFYFQQIPSTTCVSIDHINETVHYSPKRNLIPLVELFLTFFEGLPHLGCLLLCRLQNLFSRRKIIKMKFNLFFCCMNFIFCRNS